MEKIPTAEEMLKKYTSFDREGNERRLYNDEPLPAMVEFAKIHVKAALEAAYNKGEIGLFSKDEFGEKTLEETYGPEVITERENEFYGIYEGSILNAYPLENIK